MGNRPEYSSLNWLLAFNRRSFLKGGGATAALTLHRHQVPWRRLALHCDPFPPSTDLASDRITHGFRDLYSTPATQNEWGYLKASKSVTELKQSHFLPSPVAASRDTAWSPGTLPPVSCILVASLLLVPHHSPARQATYGIRIGLSVRLWQKDPSHLRLIPSCPPK